MTAFFRRHVVSVLVGAAVQLSAFAQASESSAETEPLDEDIAEQGDPVCEPIDPADYGLATVAAPRFDAARRAPFHAYIETAAQRHDVPASLIRSVIGAESSYDPLARSPKGALGLMQIMPATGSRFGATNLLDARENIDTGTRYLRFLMNRFNDELPLVVAAYNAGEGAVEKHANRIPPYAETRGYVARVLALHGVECGAPPVVVMTAGVTAERPRPAASPKRATSPGNATIGAWLEKGTALSYGLLYGRRKD